jgi:hypothetical protein
MEKTPELPEKNENEFCNWYTQDFVDSLVDLQEKKSFRYGLSIGLISGAAFTFIGFVLAFLFR